MDHRPDEDGVERTLGRATAAGAHEFARAEIEAVSVERAGDDASGSRPGAEAGAGVVARVLDRARDTLNEGHQDVARRVRQAHERIVCEIRERDCPDVPQ